MGMIPATVEILKIPFLICHEDPEWKVKTERHRNEKCLLVSIKHWFVECGSPELDWLLLDWGFVSWMKTGQALLSSLVERALLHSQQNQSHPDCRPLFPHSPKDTSLCAGLLGQIHFCATGLPVKGKRLKFCLVFYKTIVIQTIGLKDKTNVH